MFDGENRRRVWNHSTMKFHSNLLAVNEVLFGSVMFRAPSSYAPHGSETTSFNCYTSRTDAIYLMISNHAMISIGNKSV